MQPLIPSKNWHPIKASLNLATAVLLLGTPQTSRAIYAAIIAKHDITFNFIDGSFVDSYKGSYDPEAPGDNGNIASADGSAGAIFIGNADIYGFVITVSGIVSSGSDGGIGTHAWLSTNSGFEPGHIENFGITGFPSVTLPYTNGVAPEPGINVTIVDPGTNIVVTNSPTPPTVTGTEQIIACTTNAYYLTNSSYPGPMPGLVTNVIMTVASSNTILVTNCSSTQAVYIGTNPPPPVICCPGTTPLQVHGKLWYYYPITGISTNVTYGFSTNYSYIWEQTNYDYQIYQSPTYATNYYDHIVCGNYCAGTLSGTTLVTCPSTLVLTNGLDQTGVDSITIMPGASLSLYVDGGPVIIGSGGINNLSGLDTNLQIYCTPGVGLLRWGDFPSTAPLSAVIVAPDTDVYINGYGPTPVEFSGNIMANSLNVYGTFQFHGDEAVTLPTAPVVFGSVYPPSGLPAQTNPIALVGWQVFLNAGPIYSGVALQWFFDGTNLIANATNSYLSLSNVTTDMTGQYTLQESAPGLLLVSQPAWLTVLTTPAATLDSFSISASNQFQFNINGVPGYWYNVEGSSNLVNWTYLESVECPFTYTDPNPLSPQYFYRAVYLGP